MRKAGMTTESSASWLCGGNVYIVERFIEEWKLAEQQGDIFDRSKRKQLLFQIVSDTLQDLTNNPSLEVGKVCSREVTSFMDSLLLNPASPFFSVFSKLGPSKSVATIARDLVKALAKYRESGHPPAKAKRKSRSLVRPVKSQSEPIARGGETMREQLIRDAVGLAEDIQTARKLRRKQIRAVASAASKHQSSQAERQVKQASAVGKMHRLVAKQISQAVIRFWRVAETISLRQLKHGLKAELEKIRCRKQMQWVERAQRYAQKLSSRLASSTEGIKPETSRDEDEAESDSSVSMDAEWIRQEKEDRELEARMSTSSSSEEGDEADILKADNELSLSELLEKYEGAGTRPEAREEPKSKVAPQRNKRKRKLEALQRARQKVEARKRSKVEVANPRTKAEKSNPSLGSTLVDVSKLLRATLRPYQHTGFDWLLKLHDCSINGILADEMGLGKTIQSIALLAYLASNRGIWGPHLVIVPTSVVLNWESEFRKFAPGLKVVSYFGSKKERQLKRQGWQRPFAFNVCVTSYTIALADALTFRRISWYYLVLDEAQNLKNSQTARWQTLLQFHAQHRLLLTGTPLQNNLMELWSLMYFIMPEVFGTHTEWKELFSEPISTAIEKSLVSQETQMVRHLYKVLRPFLCRRLKKDVEEQMPLKVEHVVRCQLTKRQRQLYDEFLSASQASGVLDSGEYLAVANVLMQLRKVCNHPELIEDANIMSSLADPDLYVKFEVPVQLFLWLHDPYLRDVEELRSSLSGSLHPLLNIFTESLNIPLRAATRTWELQKESSRLGKRVAEIPLPSRIRQQYKSIYSSLDIDANSFTFSTARRRLQSKSLADDYLEEMMVTDQWILEQRRKDLEDYEKRRPVRFVSSIRQQPTSNLVAPDLLKLIKNEFVKRVSFAEGLEEVATPEDQTSMNQLQCLTVHRVHAQGAQISICGPGGDARLREIQGCAESTRKHLMGAIGDADYKWGLNTYMIPPHPLAVEYDSGKLLRLRIILAEALKHHLKCILFTQMSKMLNILEKFFNINGFSYLRLDGSTKADRRQKLVERFNSDSRILVFMASTRAGGVGINLTGGSVVIFYDTDWNPAMDKQAMDRCHRLGQSRDVHIYRLISETTIEENIWRKQLQKRMLDHIVVDQGKFTSDPLFGAADVRDILFTSDTTTDLYATRILHDLPSAEEELNPIPAAAVPSANDFDGAIAAVEDAEDAVALTSVRQELQNNVEEFYKEFQAAAPEIQAEEQEPSSPLAGSNFDNDSIALFVDNVVGTLKVSPLVEYGVRFLSTTSRSKAMDMEIRNASQLQKS